MIESRGLEPRQVPDDFFEGDAKQVVIPAGGKLRPSTGGLYEGRGELTGRIGSRSIRFSSPEEMDLVGLLARYGFTGRIAIPADNVRCREVIAQVSEYLDRVSQSFAAALDDLTSDDELRIRITKELWKRLRKR